LVPDATVKIANISGRIWSKTELKWFLDPGGVASGWDARR
jgi:hypothetical protein